MARPTSNRSGFTLLEVVVVLGVIGVLSAMAMPGVTSALADTRQSNTAENLVRFARQARARAARSGTAHMLRYVSTSSDHAVIELWQGMLNRCPLTPWAWAIANRGPTFDMGPIDVLDMKLSNPVSNPRKTDDGRHVIFLEASEFTTSRTVLTEVNLCYEPNGDTFSTTNLASAMTRQARSVLFDVKRTVDGDQYGANRQVVFRPGSSARIRK